MVEGHFTLGVGAWIEPEEHIRTTPGFALQPTAQAAPVVPVPPPLQWSTAPISHHHTFGDFSDAHFGNADVPFVYERSLGKQQAVDAITLRLAKQHLDTNAETPLPAAQANGLVATPFGASLSSDPSRQQPDSILCQTYRTPGLTPLALERSTARRQLVQDAPRMGTVDTSSMNLCQPKRPQRFPAGSLESLVEDMIFTGTQCRVQAPLKLASAPIQTQGPDHMRSKAALEVDQVMAEGSDGETFNVNHYLDARRAMLPTYRSSTDTAMLSQYRVEKKPRMRKRIKQRRKKPPSTPSAPDLNLTFPSTDCEAPKAD